MENISIEVENSIAVLRLENGTTNAISPELTADLSDIIRHIKNECRGLILTGGEKFFSIGFDLPSLLPLSINEISKFFYDYNQVVLNIYTLPMPTACIISGHAVGGGNILALSCDYRFMVEGNKRIGLNEINIGLPVPYLADLILRQVAGDRASTGMLFSGDLIDARTAKHTGLVDGLFMQSEIERGAMEKVRSLAQKPRSGFTEIKANRTMSVKRLYEKYGPEKDTRFVEKWFLPEVQKLLTIALDKF